MGLELYARIEPMLGFEEEATALYDTYIGLLADLGIGRVLDIGCGSGRFLSRVSARLPGVSTLGIDLSVTMVERARALGVEARAVDLCELTERFDAATAVFDVLNYLDETALRRFLSCAADRLEPGGWLLADINTLYGFDAVAQGALIRRDGGRFLALESLFDGERMVTTIDLFEPAGSGGYRRERDEIVQHYHPIERFMDLTGLQLVEERPVTLFDGDEPEKSLLLFRRV